MNGRFGRFMALVAVLGLAMMSLLFIVFLLEEVSGPGREPQVLIGMSGLLGIGWLMLRGPVGKALASMLEGRSAEDSAMLAGRVAELEDRLQEVTLETQRFLEIEERLDFTERLLAQHSGEVRRGDER